MRHLLNIKYMLKELHPPQYHTKKQICKRIYDLTLTGDNYLKPTDGSGYCKLNNSLDFTNYGDRSFASHNNFTISSLLPEQIYALLDFTSYTAGNDYFILCPIYNKDKDIQIGVTGTEEHSSNMATHQTLFDELREELGVTKHQIKQVYINCQGPSQMNKNNWFFCGIFDPVYNESTYNHNIYTQEQETIISSYENPKNTKNKIYAVCLVHKSLITDFLSKPIVRGFTKHSYGDDISGIAAINIQDALYIAQEHKRRNIRRYVNNRKKKIINISLTDYLNPNDDHDRDVNKRLLKKLNLHDCTTVTTYKRPTAVDQSYGTNKHTRDRDTNCDKYDIMFKV